MISASEQPPTFAQTALPDGQPPFPALFRLRLLGVPGLAVSEADPSQAHFREVPVRPMVLCLLAALCLDGPQRRLSMADLLWDTPSAQALRNLQTALHALRLALEPHADALRAEGCVLGLDSGRFQIDALNLGAARGEA